MSTNGHPVIKLDGVTKVFFTDEVETHALSGVHLEIAHGEYVSIAGPSGCGKSTLLSLLGLLDAPTNGRYWLNGKPAESLTLVHVDPGQLERVLLDICANAADAMPDGGEVRTETAHVGGFARLRIIDTGTGMDAQTRARAFEPFFTTKHGHTGLGLSSVHGIVHQSGGRVELASEAGTGTAVTLYLPLTDA